MTDDKHIPKDSMEILRAVSVLFAFEEGNEDIVLPVVVEAIFFLVDVVDLDYTFGSEGSQASFEEREELVLHFW